jgi:hypothetical protein
MNELRQQLPPEFIHSKKKNFCLNTLRRTLKSNAAFCGSFIDRYLLNCEKPRDRQPYLLLPILNILVLQVGHTPWVAGRPFFIVISLGSFISLFALHFTQ